jgi:hypothetical protein
LSVGWILQDPIESGIGLMDLGSLTDIRYLRRDRSTLTHHKIKTGKQQLGLLKKAKCFDFPSNFEHKELVHKMIKALDTCKTFFHRYA